MKRALALRTRAMPPCLQTRDVLALKYWRDTSQLQQNRPKSTVQELKSWEDDALESALIHGSKFPKPSNRNIKDSHQEAPDKKLHQPVPTPPGVRSSSPPDRQPPARAKSSSLQARRTGSQQPQGHGSRSRTSSRTGQAPKRKAEVSPGPRPSRKHSRAPVLSPENGVYFKTTMQAISKQYPDIPDWCFSNPKEWIHNYVQGALEAKVHSEISELGSSRGFKCDLSFQTSSQAPLQVVHGTARTKKEADHAAYFNMVHRLHELGMLGDVAASLQVEKLDQQVLTDEANAKMDIYNYAARFDAVPKIDFRVLPGRTPIKKVVEFTVRLPELNIEVVRKGRGLKQAEIAAALHFKEAAEKHHAEHGDGSIIIKDSTALTTSNARKFFDYYKIVHPKVSVEVTSKQAWSHRSLGDTPSLAQVLVDNEPTGEPVEMVGKRKAEDLAYLTAAIALKKREPELIPRFFRALKTGNGEILRPLHAIDMPLDDDAILVMRETLLSVRRAGLPDQAKEILSDEEISQNKRRPKHQLAPNQIEPRNFQLQEALSGYLKKPELEQLRKKRSELPMNQYKAKVLDQVNHNTYSIIVGATGSGKTTQVPQILLEDHILNGRGAACNIICTQPRRIAATSVARRVAEERAESLQDTVGYQVRFDAKLPNPGGSITYCTTGILLQQLQNSPDEVMDSTSHLIIDEVHERDILIDFLLIILKKVMAHRAASGKPVPKVVLMSATMDTELFANYFKNNNAGHDTSACPALSVPGRTFPVKEKFLETILEDMNKTHSAAQLRIMYSEPATRDYLQIDDRYSRENAGKVRIAPSSAGAIAQDNDFVIDWKHERKISAQGDIDVSNEKEDSIIPFALVATTIAHIAKTTENGAILVFLPGLVEMLKVDEWLRQGVLGVNFADTSKFKLSMLHSSIAGGHTEVFNAVPQGCRKIILATNIAETSITIPDVQYVVDTGKLREKQYDQLRRITKLQCTWVSKSNSKQRAGRAGRVQDGNYYALFSRTRHNSLRAIGLPEMLRSDLQEICLDIKAQAFKSPIREFLAEAIEPPAPAAVDASVVNLQALDAITDDERITPLGRLLASLPVHPSLGKMIVLGVLFRCLDPMLILGAAAAERNIFLSPLEARGDAQRAKASFAGRSASDHIALLNAVREMRRIRDTKGDYASQDFAFKNFIHNNAFKVVDATARQIEEILVEAGLIPFTPPNARSNSECGDPLLNTNSSKTALVKALALAGLHPNLAVSTGGRTLRTPGEKGTIIHPSSVNARDKSDEDRTRYGTLYSYSNMARSNDGGTLFLRDTSESTPLMATLFGGKLAQPANSKNNILEMDNWLPFYVQYGVSAGRAAKTVLEFRKALERLLAGAFRDLKVRNEGRAAEGAKKAYLADETVRELFAEGLVEVLERDVGTAKVGRAYAGEGESPGGVSRFAHARRWLTKERGTRSQRGDGASRYAMSS